MLWFTLGLLTAPYLSFGISIVLNLSLHLSSRMSTDLVVITWAIATAVVVWIRFGSKWALERKNGYSTAWLGSVTGIALVLALGSKITNF